jgi:hypothetical protein
MNVTDYSRFQIGAIDRTRPFLPESVTPLFYTPSYARLSDRARLRYNQLFASSYHEQFIFLESMLAGPILPGLIRRYADEPLGQRLVAFQAEERTHTHWFHKLHQACEPDLYRDNYYYFIRPPRLGLRLLTACAGRPRLFPFGIWLAMIIEERTIPASVEIMRSGETLEPHFVALHRLHAADEAGHVSCDGELLKRLWPALHPAARWVNRWLFVTLLREFFLLPKRAGWNVVLQVARECPEIRPLLPTLRAECRALRGNADYVRSVYSRPREPRTFALADRFQELRRLEEAILPAAAGATP